MRRRALRRLGLSLLAGAALAAGCSDEEPQTRGPSEATFTVPGSPDPAAPAPECPPGGVTPTGADAAVRVADLRGPRPAAPRTLQTAREVLVRCVRWSSWGGERAEGEGVARILECRPTCANGQVRLVRAGLVLSGRRRCRGTDFYDTAAMTLRGGDGGRAPAAYVDPPC